MKHQVIGYIRISSQTQNTARQLSGIKTDRIFTDIITGSVKSRPQLDECLKYIREGDLLVVDSIDRLARNLRHLQEILGEVLDKGVTVRFVKENLSFSSQQDPMSVLMIQMMGSFAEFERNMIRSRQKEGIEAAKKAGKHLGRPCKVNSKFIKLVQEKINLGLSIRKTAKDLEVSRVTIYKSIKKLQELNKEK